MAGVRDGGMAGNRDGGIQIDWDANYMYPNCISCISKSWLELVGDSRSE